jgi:hypothetical protein
LQEVLKWILATITAVDQTWYVPQIIQN